MQSGTATKSPEELVHASTTTAASSGLVLVEEKSEADESDGRIGKLHIDVLVALHARLSQQLVVNLSRGEGSAVGDSKCMIVGTGERLSMLVEGDGSGEHGLLQVLLM